MNRKNFRSVWKILKNLKNLEKFFKLSKNFLKISRILKICKENRKITKIGKKNLKNLKICKRNPTKLMEYRHGIIGMLGYSVIKEVIAQSATNIHEKTPMSRKCFWGEIQNFPLWERSS